MNHLDLIAWNCYVGNSDVNVTTTLRDWAEWFEPDVFVLSEASTHADALGKVHGYTVLQQPPPVDADRSDDTGDCAILVSNRHVIRNHWVARMREWWTVLRYGIRHQPHRYEVATVKVRRQLWRIRSSHWPTHGFDGPNAEAFLESAQKSRRWLRFALSPSVDAGDLNERREVLAEWFGDRYAVFGSGIDCAVTRHVTGCEVEELSKGGGDHHGRRYKFLD